MTFGSHLPIFPAVSTMPTGSPELSAADLRERARVEAVHALGLLDGPLGPDVEDLVRLAAEVCDVPNAMLNIFDDHWQHSVATFGRQPPSIPLEAATCFPVLLSGIEMITGDAREEPRIADHPYVNGTLADLRFYASVPLITEAGHVVGTLCAYDLDRHEVQPAQIRLMRALAAQLVGIFELRRAVAQVEQIADRLADETERADAVLASSTDAYFAARPDGVVTAWNPAAEGLFGYRAAEAIGQDLARLIVPVGDVERFRGLSLEHARERTDLRKLAHRKDGSELMLGLRIWPNHAHDGWHAFARDITELDAAERERDAAEERWRVAFEAAPVGVLVSDLTTLERPLVVSANRKYTEILGYSLEQLQVVGLAGVIHPEQVDQDLAAVVRLLDGSLEVYRVDKRYLHADGHVVWGRLTASIARSGDKVYMISQVEDITTLLADERARERAERLLTIAFDHAPHGTAIIGVTDHDRGRLLRVNPALVDMTGREDLAGSRLSDLLDPDPESRTDEMLARFEQVAAGELENLDRVCRLRAGHGYIFVQATITLSRDLEGRPEHALAQLRDVTAQQAHEEWLTRHAKTDELTGLANRLAMRERLEAEIDDLRFGHGALAVLMLDLDRFKAVNDTLGHEAGDELLLQVAEVLLNELPAQALAARLGGDEFVVIAPQQSTTGAIRLAERIAAAVDELGAQLSDRMTGCVTCSVGLVTTENPATAPQDLIRAADQAMYRNKRNRNRARDAVVSI